jgi:hypothetical protein
MNKGNIIIHAILIIALIGGMGMATITSLADGTNMTTQRTEINTNFTNVNVEVVADTAAIGTLASLTTTAKTDLVVAINEIDGHADTANTSIGTLASLTTTAKTDLVVAINEVNTIQTPILISSFLNSWVNYGGTLYRSAGYYKDRNRVYLQGVIKSGSLTTAAFNLPAGYRPSKNTIIPVVANGNFSYIIVGSGGDVTIYGSDTFWVSLEGVSFEIS